MKTFKQFMEAKNLYTYGWLNNKGSFIKNRGRDSHGATYTKHTGVDDQDYFGKIDHAIENGWARLDMYADPKNKRIEGVKQYKKDKWTPRHEKALKRIKRAMGTTKYKDETENAIVEYVDPVKKIIKAIEKKRGKPLTSTQEFRTKMKDLADKYEEIKKKDNKK